MDIITLYKVGKTLDLSAKDFEQMLDDVKNAPRNPEKALSWGDKVHTVNSSLAVEYGLGLLADAMNFAGEMEDADDEPIVTEEDARNSLPMLTNEQFEKLNSVAGFNWWEDDDLVNVIKTEYGNSSFEELLDAFEKANALCKLLKLM